MKRFLIPILVAVIFTSCIVKSTEMVNLDEEYPHWTFEQNLGTMHNDCGCGGVAVNTYQVRISKGKEIQDVATTERFAKKYKPGDVIGETNPE